MVLTIIYDLETSGFNPSPMYSQNHKILQIAARDHENNKMFVEFVNPCLKGGVPIYSSNIHHIHTEDVDDKDTFDKVFYRFLEYFEIYNHERVIMIAHNGSNFDEIILKKECHFYGIDFPKHIEFQDTLPTLRKNVRYLKKFSLEHVHMKLFNEPINNAHRADADVYALARIYYDFILKNNIPMVLEEEPACVQDCLTTIRGVGEYRAYLFYLNGIETCTALKQKFNELQHKFDFWLIHCIKIFSVTDRMNIISRVSGIPLWDSKIYEYIHTAKKIHDMWILDNVDCYLTFRYKLNEKPPCNLLHSYMKGLEQIRNAQKLLF